MRNVLISTAIAIAATAVTVTPAAAVEVYTITGTGSGFLGAYEFDDARFKFTLTGSLANYSSGGGFSVIDPLDDASFTIAGTGSGTLSIPTRLYVLSGSAGLSLAGEGGADIFDFLTPPISDMTQHFVVHSTFVYALYQFQDIATTAGGLSFYAASNVTFANGAIPEPAAWTLMIAGFGLIGTALRRRAVAFA
jgi:hypothetical protein